MVTVPTYQRNVADRPILQQGITTHASPEDMGAGIGRGLQSLSNGADAAIGVAAQLQSLDDATRAKEADNALAEWSRNAMYGDGGYMTLEGKAAVDGRSAFEKAWEEKRKALGEGLSPGATKAYTSASQARQNQVLESAIVHSANERKSWVKAASASRVQTFGDDALANFNNPKKVDFNIAAGQAELRSQAALEGWGKDTLAAAEAGFVSGVHQNVALRIAQTDPIAARDYVTAHKDSMTGKDQASVEAALATAVKVEQSKRAADAIMGNVAPGADFSPTGRDENAAAAVAAAGEVGKSGSVETMLAKIADPDVRDMTRQRIATMQAANNSAAAANLKATKTDAFTVIENGGSPDDLPLEAKQALGVEGMASLWAYYQKKASGDHVITDDTVFYNLTRDAARNPDSFSRIDLNDVRDKLSPTDFKSLQDKQAAILSDQHKAKTDGLQLTTAFSQADDALKGVGITTVGKQGADLDATTKRIAQFQNALSAQLAEFKRAHDGINPDQGEVQKIINRLLLPVVIKAPGDVFHWGGNNRDGFVFDAATRADGTTVDVAVKYDDIPLDLRNGIKADLEAELGRKASEDEVTARYEEFVLNN